MNEKNKIHKKIKIPIMLPVKAYRKTMQDYIPLDVTHPDYNSSLDGGPLTTTIEIDNDKVEIPFSVLRLKTEDFLRHIEAVKNLLKRRGIDIYNYYPRDFPDEKSRRDFIEKAELKRRNKE